MMGLNVGTDICQISRIQAVLDKHGDGFLDRVLTASEKGQKVWTAAALARRWALKEAVAKACGTGIGAAIGFHDIVVTYGESGAPLVAVAGYAIKASVSDDGDYAVAFAVAEKVR